MSMRKRWAHRHDLHPCLHGQDRHLRHSKPCHGRRVNGTYLFARKSGRLPGRVGRDLVKQLDYRHVPCNFVEIFPVWTKNRRK